MIDREFLNCNTLTRKNPTVLRERSLPESAMQARQGCLHLEETEQIASIATNSRNARTQVGDPSGGLALRAVARG